MSRNRTPSSWPAADRLEGADCTAEGRLWWGSWMLAPLPTSQILGRVVGVR
jgi:hypothetical protein